jgi:predicted nucleic acid-binding protein
MCANVSEGAQDCLLDTGPLVALIDHGESAHLACVAAITGRRGRLITTDAVITEALYLLADSSVAVRACLGMILDGTLAVELMSLSRWGRVQTLMAKYADLPMDYADATLVVLAEDLGLTQILTLDRRDFSVYRVRGNRAFRILP